jgi:predicted amidohydrolase YtcJ
MAVGRSENPFFRMPDAVLALFRYPSSAPAYTAAVHQLVNREMCQSTAPTTADQRFSMSSLLPTLRRLARLMICCSLALCSGQNSATKPGTLHVDHGAATPPDLLVLHAHVITINPRQPIAQAFAVAAGKITWIGSDPDALKQFPSPKQTIDLRGQTVLPGIIDSHTHLFELGKSLLRLNLKDVQNEDEVISRVRERVASTPKGDWIVGWGWDEGKWAAHYPDNEALSRVSPDSPVFLIGLHTFAAWANEKALAMAGINKNTPDPQNGKIIRDANGAPTGILLNSAQSLVENKLPPVTVEDAKNAITVAAAECVRNGLTSVHEARVSAIMLQAYRELIREHRLPLRIYAMLDGADKAFVQEWLARGPEIDPNHQLTVRAFKLFADGALGSRGAWLLEPYSDAPQTKGVVTTPQSEIHDLTRRSLEKGFQVCTHAIGDAANRMTLDAYEQAEHEVPAARDARLRIEHAQVLAPSDIPRFAQLHAIPSMQPAHCTSDMTWAEKRVGPERVQGAYAWQSLSKTGVHLPLSSDFPGETLNPFYGIYAAITRQDPNGNPAGGWYPAQRLTLDQALRGYTIEGAYAEFQENAKGSLEPGKLADFVVIDRDMTQLPPTPKDILSIHVLKTFVSGKPVFDLAAK